jgi:DNA-directed RNA polymerase specialized sigma24 family protein
MRMATHQSRLLALNDPRLEAYLTARDDRSRGRELERILTEDVQRRVRAVVNEYVHSDWPIEPQDVDDIVGHVTLLVLRKLRAATVLEEESVQSVEAYVTTLTKNAVRDLMRRRSPERTRLKSRLRYLFRHDSRLALWSWEGVTLCGLAAWKGRGDYDVQLPRELADVTGDSMLATLTAIGKPLRLADLVAAYVALEQEVAPRANVATAPPHRDAFEARQYLQILWREIRELPPNQRAALLLNLREPGSGNAVTLFVAMGIASLEEIADAVEMPVAQLSTMWDGLPLDDLRIAAHLGVLRQQVINLRKSARERLARRMAGRGSRG